MHAVAEIRFPDRPDSWEHALDGQLRAPDDVDRCRPREGCDLQGSAGGRSRGGSDRAGERGGPIRRDAGAAGYADLRHGLGTCPAHNGDGQGGASPYPPADDAARRRFGPAAKGLHERRLPGGYRSVLRQAPGTLEGPLKPGPPDIAESSNRDSPVDSPRWTLDWPDSDDRWHRYQFTGAKTLATPRPASGTAMSGAAPRALP